MMKTLWQTFRLVAIIFGLALIADQIEPLKQFSLYLDQHPRPYTTIAIVLAVTGWVLLGVTFVLIFWKKSRLMSEEEARQFIESNGPIQHFSGQTAGREAKTEWTFREIKESFHSGAVWRNSSEFAVFLGLIGLALAAYGMFGYFIIIGPPLVKLACAGALAYATVLTAWSFWKA
jgi:hypothetical protein